LSAIDRRQRKRIGTRRLRSLSYRKKKEPGLYDLGPKLPFIREHPPRPPPKKNKGSTIVGTLEDEAINKIAQNFEAFVLPQNPLLALTTEAVRQAYNHRDYLCDICRELASTRPAGEKIENMKDRTADEIKAELVSLLTSGGIQAVSSQLRQLGFFERPFGAHGPNLDARTSAVFQGFFESSVADVIGMGASA
jgi:hypothetical protein